MTYKVKRTSRFKKDFEKIRKRGLDIKEFEVVLKLLINGEVIPEKYQDHPLRNTKDYYDCRELHIKPDWLLIYKYYSNELILMLTRTGSHSDLF